MESMENRRNSNLQFEIGQIAANTGATAMVELAYYQA